MTTFALVHTETMQQIARRGLDHQLEGKPLQLIVIEMLDELTARRREPRVLTLDLDVLEIHFEGTQPFVIAQPSGETGIVRIEQESGEIIITATGLTASQH